MQIGKCVHFFLPKKRGKKSSFNKNLKLSEKYFRIKCVVKLKHPAYAFTFGELKFFFAIKVIVAFLYFRLRDSIRNIMSISRLGNQFMQSNKPWVLVKGSADDK